MQFRRTVIRDCELQHVARNVSNLKATVTSAEILTINVITTIHFVHESNSHQ